MDALRRGRACSSLERYRRLLRDGRGRHLCAAGGLDKRRGLSEAGKLMIGGVTINLLLLLLETPLLLLLQRRDVILSMITFFVFEHADRL